MPSRARTAAHLRRSSKTPAALRPPRAARAASLRSSLLPAPRQCQAPAAARPAHRLRASCPVAWTAAGGGTARKAGLKPSAGGWYGVIVPIRRKLHAPTYVLELQLRAHGSSSSSSTGGSRSGSGAGGGSGSSKGSRSQVSSRTAPACRSRSLGRASAGGTSRRSQPRPKGCALHAVVGKLCMA